MSQRFEKKGWDGEEVYKHPFPTSQSSLLTLSPFGEELKKYDDSEFMCESLSLQKLKYHEQRM